MDWWLTEGGRIVEATMAVWPVTIPLVIWLGCGRIVSALNRVTRAIKDQGGPDAH